MYPIVGKCIVAALMKVLTIVMHNGHVTANETLLQWISCYFGHLAMTRNPGITRGVEAPVKVTKELRNALAQPLC